MKALKAGVDILKLSGIGKRSSIQELSASLNAEADRQRRADAVLARRTVADKIKYERRRRLAGCMGRSLPEYVSFCRIRITPHYANLGFRV